MPRSIAAKLYLSFLAMAALVAASAAFMLVNLKQASTARALLLDNTRDVQLLAHVQQAAWELQLAVEGAGRDQAAATEREVRANKQFEEATEAFGRVHQGAGHWGVDVQGELRALEAVRSAHKAYLEAFAQRPEWRAEAGAGSASAWYEKVAMPRGREMRAALDKLVALQEADLREAQAEIARGEARTRTLVLGFALGAVAAALAIAYAIIHSIVPPLARMTAIVHDLSAGDFTRRMGLRREDEFGALAQGFDQMSEALARLVAQVQDSGRQVSDSLVQISGTAQQQRATATEIAATTTEIGATSLEISATSKELVKTMNQVAQVAEETAQLAGSGHAGLGQMEETMRHVMDAAAAINAKLSVLNEKAGNINRVVTTITKVADQTNLLSLNAAIEAEKAGEYGRGFAVVATEIRRLADQTAVATYDIEQMVKEIQSAVAAGVMGMDRFSEDVRVGIEQVREVGMQLSRIIQQVQALAPRVESVNEGMQAQATGAEQISQALAQLVEASRQTVDSLGQSGRAIDELNEVAKRLREGIARFRLVA